MNQEKLKKSPFLPPPLPPGINLETVAILKQAAKAHRYLAELKGACRAIPNQSILINTLSLQEAKDSSAVENIITTQDELFQQTLFEKGEAGTAAAKEVQNYSLALKLGFDIVKKSGQLTNNTVKEIQAALELNRAGFRRLPGTELKNQQTGETIYVPPQHPSDIDQFMGELETFINDDTVSPLDPLIKMTLVHYQFETIHPFYDGNGRTGRILNILYLVQKGLLDIPVLYLSRFVIQNKSEYYRLLQAVRDHGDWESWTLFMLTGVEKTARQTLSIVQGIREAMLDYKHRIRHQFKFYSQDLLNNLFSHPYTKINFIMRDIDVKRITATKYLDLLAKENFLVKRKLGRSNYYINPVLFDLLTKIPDSE